MENKHTDAKKFLSQLDAESNELWTETDEDIIAALEKFAANKNLELLEQIKKLEEEKKELIDNISIILDDNYQLPDWKRRQLQKLLSKHKT